MVIHILFPSSRVWDLGPLDWLCHTLIFTDDSQSISSPRGEWHVNRSTYKFKLNKMKFSVPQRLWPLFKCSTAACG